MEKVHATLESANCKRCSYDRGKLNSRPRKGATHTSETVSGKRVGHNVTDKPKF